MGDITRTKEYKTLKADLLDDLEQRGLVQKVYSDKVDEYMELWRIAKELRADIEARGTTVFDQKRGMEVENRSVSLFIQTSKQMLALYAALGFKDAATGAKATVEAGEDYEL